MIDDEGYLAMSDEALIAMGKSALDTAIDGLDDADREDYRVMLAYTRMMVDRDKDYVCRQLALHSVQLAKYQGLSLPKFEGKC